MEDQYSDLKSASQQMYGGQTQGPSLGKQTYEQTNRQHSTQNVNAYDQRANNNQGHAYSSNRNQPTFRNVPPLDKHSAPPPPSQHYRQTTSDARNPHYTNQSGRTDTICAPQNQHSSDAQAQHPQARPYNQPSQSRSPHDAYSQSNRSDEHTPHVNGVHNQHPQSGRPHDQYHNSNPPYQQRTKSEDPHHQYSQSNRPQEQYPQSSRKPDPPPQSDSYHGQQPQSSQARNQQPQPSQARNQQPHLSQSSNQQPQPSQARNQQPQPSQARNQQPQPSQSSNQQPQPSQARNQQPQPSQARNQQPQPSQSRNQQPQPSQSRNQHPQSSHSRNQHPQSSQSRNQHPQSSHSRNQHPQSSQSSNQHPQPSQSRNQNPQPSQSRNQPPQPSSPRDHIVQSNRHHNEPKRHAPVAPNTQAHSNTPVDGQQRWEGPPQTRGSVETGPTAPPRSSSKSVVQKYGAPPSNQSSHEPTLQTKSQKDYAESDDVRHRTQQQTANRDNTSTKPYGTASHGFTNNAYTTDDGRVRIDTHSPNKDTVQYNARAPTDNSKYLPNQKESSDKHLGTRTSESEHSKRKYNSTTAVNVIGNYASDSQRDPLQNPYAIPPGSDPHKYGSMSALHIQQRPVPTAPPLASLPQAPQEGRKYERRAAGHPSQAQPPRKTKRGRILSHHEQAHQRPHQGPSQVNTNPTGFNSAPPVRAQSVSDLHIALSTDPNPSHTNLHRPQSVPNISAVVQSQDVSIVFNQNGQAPGGTGLWKSKSLLDLALTQEAHLRPLNQEASNLRRSKSLQSLILANPNLARTASTMALYEMEVAKGNRPKDHNLTLVLSIVALCLFFPFGIPLVILTVWNDPHWADSLHYAITINNRLFWGAVASIVFAAFFWITLIMLLLLHLV